MQRTRVVCVLPVYREQAVGVSLRQTHGSRSGAVPLKGVGGNGSLRYRAMRVLLCTEIGWNSVFYAPNVSKGLHSGLLFC